MREWIRKVDQVQGNVFGGRLRSNKPVTGGRLSNGRRTSSIFYWSHSIAEGECEFGLHGHEGFEILTFVLRGENAHYDTVSRTWKALREGDGYAACGGSTASSNLVDGTTSADGGSPDGGGSADGGAGQEGTVGLSPNCPATVPGIKACATPGATCEYGGKGAYLACSTIATCGPNGVWLTKEPRATCTAAQSDNEPGCPSSFGALASGDACPAVKKSCAYAEGVCECVGCSPPDASAGGNHWSCVPWPAPTSDCTLPRPRAGSACATAGLECYYGSVCTTVNLGLPTIKCVKGVWESQSIPAPPCALATCGQ
jgi:hypothetical protein